MTLERMTEDAAARMEARTPGARRIVAGDLVVAVAVRGVSSALRMADDQ